MQLLQAVALIQHSISQQKTIWADLGCGDGLFTNALSQLLINGSLIYAVDKNKRPLKNVEVRDGTELKKLALNFVTDEIQVKNLSGILMANSFHFIKDKNTFINKLFNCLGDDGYIIMVEYDTDKSNFWVPYPMSFNNLKKFFMQYNCTTEKLHTMPSRFNGTIYSAIIHKH